MNDAAKTHIIQGIQRRKLLSVSIILLIAWVAMTYAPLLINNRIVRLLADYDDRAAYFERGKWFTENTYPISEYPQIPTFLFGVNHLFSMWSEPRLEITIYSAIFSLEMLIVLFLAFKVLLDLLPPRQSNYAFLMLLPPALYFTFCRFDILPAYLCLIAYSAATKKHWGMVSIILAIATFTKWYPILLFPGFLMYASEVESKFQWKMILIFTITNLVILLPSFLYGGLGTILAPYQFHVTRNMEYVSLPILINDFFHHLLNLDINISVFFLFFFIMQISAPFLIAFIKMDSLAQLTDYCIIVIGFFILFSRIWSPQWFLWLLPFLLISAKNIKFVGLIIAYSFINYLNYPILFDYYGSSSYQLKISSLLAYIFLFAIIFRSIKNLKFSKITEGNSYAK